MIYSTEVWQDFDNKIKQFGVREDLRSLTTLELNFFERYGSYVVVNLREFSSTQPNNLMVLSEGDNFLYSSQKLDEENYKLFKYTLKKKYGESTVLALMVLKKVLSNYSADFEKINAEIDRQEEILDAVAIERLGRHLRKLNDFVEDFLDVLIKLEDREVREVNTSYISYDYDVLLGKTRHLLDRIKSHQAQITGLRNEIELHSTRELNKRIENLTQIMRRLTAITVVLIIPNIITGFYGMNFSSLPFADWMLGPLAVIIASAVLMALGIVYFLKKGWL